MTTLTGVESTVDLQRYPKAGDPNPKVRLGVVEVRAGAPEPEWLEFNGEYLPRFSWVGDSRLIVQTLDRAQGNLRLESIEVLSNKRDTLMTERDRDRINVHDDLRVLGGGSQFLWSSERSGLRHLYLYSGGGKLVRRLTEGDWEVSSVRGIDKEASIVDFTANRDNPIGSDLYAVQLKGGPVRRVTSGIGTHAVLMNPSATHYVDARSTMEHPGDVVVRSPGGGLSRVIHEAQSIDGYELAEPELGTIRSEDRSVIRTLLLKPTRLERGKKYPLDADPRHSGQQRASAEHTFWMVDALIDASKPYELQLYPGQTHGISGEQDRLHLTCPH